MSASSARVRVPEEAAAATSSARPLESPSIPAARMPQGSLPPSGPVSARVPVSGGDPAQTLRRFFAEKVDDDNRDHARVFIEAAERELAAGNVVAAAAQFRLALTCCDAPEIRMAYEAVDLMAQDRRFDMNKGQAEAAERDGRWADAVGAYTRAHAARPDGRVGERLANAIRRSSGDLRVAAKLAEDAVQQEPTNTVYRVTLGEIYIDAGLVLRAESEAKKAMELAPADPKVQELAAKLAKPRGA